MKSIWFASLIASIMAFGTPGRAQEAGEPLSVSILAINDFHGNLLSPGGIRIRDPNDPGKQLLVPAGGAETMATLVRERRQVKRNATFVAAGDLIGASPLL